MSEQQFLTIKDVSKMLTISVSCIELMLKNGEMVQPDYKITRTRKRLWKRETIQNWMDVNCSNKEKTA